LSSIVVFVEIDWTEKRVDRLEKRVDERMLQLEKRNYERVDAIYSLIMWIMVVAALWGLSIAAIVAAAAH